MLPTKYLKILSDKILLSYFMEDQSLRWEVRGREAINQDKLQQNYCIK